MESPVPPRLAEDTYFVSREYQLRMTRQRKCPEGDTSARRDEVEKINADDHAAALEFSR